MLRPYQTEIKNEVRAHMLAGVRDILVEAPTGSGKTVFATDLLASAAKKSISSLFVVHRQELIEQSSATFTKFGVPHGIIAAGYQADPRHLVQVGSVGSLPRRLATMRKPGLIVFDECHHCPASSWSKIHAVFSDAFKIGLSATPRRLDGKGLSDFFKVIVHGPKVSWLIENGYLSPYKIYSPSSTVSMEGVRTRAGEYVGTDLATVMGKPSVTGSAIKEYLSKAKGKRAIVFESSIELSKQRCAEFNRAGISSEHVDGTTPKQERSDSIARFRDGRTLCLFNVDLFGEGFDVPAVECVIDLSPTQSLSKWLQRCGRALRPAEGKEFAIILDHSGNCVRHGFPDDERVWTLEGTERVGSSTSTLSVRVCPDCHASQRSGPPSCKECGLVFPVQARVIEQIDGELVAVSAGTLKKLQAHTAREEATLKYLISLGRKRGYNAPHSWAKAIFNGQRAKIIAQGRKK